MHSKITVLTFSLLALLSTASSPAKAVDRFIKCEKINSLKVRCPSGVYNKEDESTGQFKTSLEAVSDVHKGLNPKMEAYPVLYDEQSGNGVYSDGTSEQTYQGPFDAGSVSK